VDKDLVNGLVTITVAIIGVAWIAVILSKNSNTGGVLQAYGNAFSQLLGTAEAPVTGSAGSATTFSSGQPMGIG
jgi:hypothetical protein